MVPELLYRSVRGHLARIWLLRLKKALSFAMCNNGGKESGAWVEVNVNVFLNASAFNES